MNTMIYELSDDRKLGVNGFEVISFPTISVGGISQQDSCQQTAMQFAQLLSELHKLCDATTCIEILWITEAVKNQIMASKIRIFCILRKIGNEEQQLSVDLSNIQSNWMKSLSALQFHIQEIDGIEESLSRLLSSVEDSCLYSVVKREKCSSSMNSMYPYYYSEIVPNKNVNNFTSLIASLSQYENCCVSFQLFPTQLTNGELHIINEMSSQLSSIVSGTMTNRGIYRDMMAEEPLKVYSYYNERRTSPIFLYNLLVFGEKSICASLATKLMSHLQYGDEKIVTSDFMCLDLSNENIRLSKQFPYYVWNVNNKMIYYYRNQKLQKVLPIAKQMSRLPYIMTAEEAVAFWRLPLYEKNMTAINSNQVAFSKEQFSDAVVSEENIKIGMLASSEGAKITIGCPEKSFTKHALIVGTPGSGKTTFSINLLLQFVKKGIPFLAIEPTKSEYRAMIDAIPDLQIFTPGNNIVSPFIINPFIPPKGIRIEQYIPSLASAFKAAFSMPSPLDMIFLKAIRSCYTQYGWKDYSKVGDSDVTLFGLYEFVIVFKKLMESTNYSKDVRGNIESAGLLRLTNLIEQNSNIYDSINTVPIEDLLTASTVLELNSIDNSEQKSLLMALLLINICVYTKHNHVGDGELKNVILIDEAHVLLGSGTSVSKDGVPDSQGTTIKALQDMIAEIRSYGTSIIIADQSPTKVSREVVANTDIKISFRLTQLLEKEMIADSTNMDEEARNNLSKLSAGEAYVYYSQLEYPQLVITEDIREKECIRLHVTDREIADRETYWEQHKEMLKPYKECCFCSFCEKECSFKIRADAEYIANSAFERYRVEIKSDEDFRKLVYHLPEIMKKEFDKYSGEIQTRIQICSRIKLIRKIQLELPVKLSDKDKGRVITSLQKNGEE